MIVVDGAQIQGVYRNGQACPVFYNGVQVWPDSPGPSGLPPRTMRLQFDNTSFDPSVDCYSASGDYDWSFTKVDDGIYDFHYDSQYWYYGEQSYGRYNSIFQDVRTSTETHPLDAASLIGNWVDIIDSNMYGVTSLSGLFYPFYRKLRNVKLCNTQSLTDVCWGFSGGVSIVSLVIDPLNSVTDASYFLEGCENLTELPVLYMPNVTTFKSAFSRCHSLRTFPTIDTSSVTDMSSMFYECYGLTTVPLLNTSSVTDMRSMFAYCFNVTGGALALYNQAANQSNPPSQHSYTFLNCGYRTTTGAAELAQIPTTWGGTMAV